MNAFETKAGEKEEKKTKEETKETTKKEETTKTAVVVKPVLKSRVKNDPFLWEEACDFSEMLSFCRPADSKSERKFIAKYIVPIGGLKYDKAGNIYKRIGENPIVLWSCHTDTVHRHPGEQKIQYYAGENGELFFESSGPNATCLGADDTTGVWLMIQMIKANVPGLYIFHRGEEIGCVGSKWIAENNKKALEGIKFAIALDRRDTKSIITYQMSYRCCSDEFAKSLADQLGMGHKADETGSTTDTRSYVDLIPECTNLSVGYYDAHSRMENTNVDYLFRLRDALCKIDVTKLVEKRKPGENTYRYTYSGESYHYNGGYHGGWESWDHDGKWVQKPNGVWTRKSESKEAPPGGVSGDQLRKKYGSMNDWLKDYWWDNRWGAWYPRPVAPKSDPIHYGLTYNEAVKMIKENPEAVADLLESLGLKAKEIRQHLIDIGLEDKTAILL